MAQLLALQILLPKAPLAKTSKPRLLPKLSPGLLAKSPGTQLPTGPRFTQLLLYLSSVNATSSLPTWGTRDCPTAPTEPGMLGHDYTKAYKFPTHKSLLDRELGGLLFTP
ncbi:unnamed protein product [Prunus armeniaca]